MTPEARTISISEVAAGAGPNQKTTYLVRDRLYNSQVPDKTKR